MQPYDRVKGFFKAFRKSKAELGKTAIFIRYPIDRISYLSDNVYK